MSLPYQLTKHPIGSVREIWAMSWPLMLGLISTSLMMFCDRLMLSWYSPLSLNAGASGGMANYIFAVVPISICSISEVLAGRLNGEGKLAETGKAVWQMVWFALMLLPLFAGLAYWIPPYLFYGSHNLINETAYFQPLLCFSPFLGMAVALSGFFIATGNVKIVTFCTIASNVWNIGADYLLIFGWGPIPEMGVWGASFATGAGFVIQVALYLIVFLKKSHRERYGTARCAFNFHYFIEGLKIGTPAGLGHAIEVIAHFAFFRIVMMSGEMQMTVVALVQSFYLLVNFVIEGLSKGVGGIASNLLGAKQFSFLSPVFKAAIKLHSFFFLLVITVVWLYPHSLIELFLSGDGTVLLQDAQVVKMTVLAFMWMSLFFLFDGYAWILIGFLTSAGDTKFIFYVSAILNWVGYVVPAFFIIGMNKNGADVAMMIIAVYSAINFALYFWRYHSGKWLGAYFKQKSLEQT